MKEVKITVYSATELEKRALHKAHLEWLSTYPYPHGDDNYNSLKKFESVFRVAVRHYSYGGTHKSFKLFLDEDIHDDMYEGNIRGNRLAKYIWNNYKQYLYTMKIYHKGGIGKDTKFWYSKIQPVYDNCPLTGYCIDNSLIQPILDFLRHPTKYNMCYYDLMCECVKNWLKECDDDYESYYSKENFLEVSKENDWHYTKDGMKWEE